MNKNWNSAHSNKIKVQRYFLFMYIDKSFSLSRMLMMFESKKFEIIAAFI